VFRLVWRRLHPRRWRAGSPAENLWPRAAATDCLLYVIMLVMPLSGYILATAAARPSPYFGLFSGYSRR
jgi:cytochrome b561